MKWQGLSPEAFITGSPSTPKSQGTRWGHPWRGPIQSHMEQPTPPSPLSKGPAGEHSTNASDLALQELCHTSKYTSGYKLPCTSNNVNDIYMCHSPGSPLELLSYWVGDQTNWFPTPTKGCRTSWTCWCAQRDKNLLCTNIGSQQQPRSFIRRNDWTIWIWAKGVFQIQLYPFYCIRGSFLLCSLCTYYKKIVLNR